MAIELLLIVLGVVLFGGMILALATGLSQGRAEESTRTGLWDDLQSGFYAKTHSEATKGEAVVLYLEDYLRRETVRAQRFAQRPSVETLLEEDDRARKAV